MIRVFRRSVKFTADFVVSVAAWLVAVQLVRGSLVGVERVALINGVYIGALNALVLGAFGVYRRIWRYSSLKEALSLTAGIGCSFVLLTMLSLFGVIAVNPRVLFISSAFALLGLGALRAGRRLQALELRRRWSDKRKSDSHRSQRTLILGAGDTANALLSDIVRHGRSPWLVAGLLDDDPTKHGERLRGVPVFGSTTELESMIRKHGIEHVVIAMPQIDRATLRGLISRAQSAGATVQAIPTLDGVLNLSTSAGTAVTLDDLRDSAEIKRSLLPKVQRDRSDRLILVTGGAGYIGTHLVRKLLDRGHRVRVLDNFTYGREPMGPLHGNPRLEVHNGDISSVRDVVAAVKDADVVIALAAIVGDPACGLDAEETLNLNFESTKILAEACNFYGVDRLVFASSCSVYGAAKDDLLTENSPLNPVSLYARTRILSEQVIRERCGDVTPVILRLATVFGLSPRMRFDLVVNTLTVRAVVERQIQIMGGDQWRPFVHCQDVAEAFAAAGLAPKELVDGQVFNVGSTGNNYTLSEVGDIVARVVGKDVEVVTGEFNEDRRNYRVSFDKIERELGWRAGYSVEEGIREMAAAIAHSDVLRDYQQSRFSNLKFLRDRFDTMPNLRLSTDLNPSSVAS